MEKHKTSLFPFILLITPLALLFPLAPIRLLWLLLLLIYAGGSLYSKTIRSNIQSSRNTPGDSLFYGEQGFVEIIIKNNSKLPATNILVEDRPDFDLGYSGRQRFLVSLAGKTTRRLRYRIRGGKRGQFLIRGWQVSASDIFGQFPWSRFHDHSDIITVYPRIFSLSGLFRSYRQPFGNIRNKFPIFEEPSRNDGIRPYHAGDARRLINWKQSARSGSLVVNKRMPSISRRTLILVNLHAPDYDFRYKEYYIELALELTASVAEFLRTHKQEFGILVRGELREIRKDRTSAEVNEERQKNLFRIDPGSGGRHLREILELLAKIHPQSEVSLPEELTRNSFEPGSRTTLLVLSPDLSPEAGAQIGALKQTGVDPAVILFGPNIRKGYGISRFHIPVSSARLEDDLLLLETLYE